MSKTIKLEDNPMTNQEQAADLRIAAAVNRHYARMCQETYRKTGRASALYQAELHAACAEQKEAQADSLGSPPGEKTEGGSQCPRQ